MLAVRIDNRPGAATIPGFGARGAPEAWYDWWTYGGIVRDVWLTESGPAWSRTSEHPQRTDCRARAGARPHFLQARSAAAPRCSCDSPPMLRTTGRRRAPHSRCCSLPGRLTLVVSLKLPNRRLWSIDHPNVYRMAPRCWIAHGKLLDEQQRQLRRAHGAIRDRHLISTASAYA